MEITAGGTTDNPIDLEVNPERDALVDKALNTRGFLEFMAAHPGSTPEDVNNSKLVESRFALFEANEAVKKEVKEIYKGQIFKDFGIKLEAGDTRSIDAYLDKRAIEEPEKIHKLKEKLVLFKALPEEINRLRTQIGDLAQTEGMRQEVLNKKTSAELDTAKGEFKQAVQAGQLGTELSTSKNKLDTVGNALIGKKWFGLRRVAAFFPQLKSFVVLEDDKQAISDSEREIYDAQRQLGADFRMVGITKGGLQKLSSRLQQRIGVIETSLGNINSAGEQLFEKAKLFNEARKELLGEVSGIGELVEMVQRRAQESLELMLARATDVKQFVETQAKFERLKKSQGESETKIDPLALVNEEDYQVMLNQATENKVFDEISEAVNNFGVSPKNTFGKLESILEPYLKMDRLGSADKEVTRRFVIEAIQNAYDNIPQDDANVVKRMMLTRILFKAKRT